MRRGREIALALGSLLVALLAFELGLRAFSRHPIDDAATRIPDPMLRWRMNPALPGVDARGFRNLAALEHAEIAVLGDSFAYGFNAAPEGSWPRQLERASGRSVYNFGVGGFGVLEYWYLLDQALALRPSRVLVALYLANDLTDVCPRLVESAEWRSFAAARGLDGSGCPAPRGDGARSRKPAEFEPWPWLVRRSALASLVEVATAEQRVAVAIALDRVDDAFVVKEEGIQTVVHLRRLRGIRERTDVARPDVAAGFEVARAFFAAARDRAAGEGARLGVLLVPSKERVYARRLTVSGIQRPAAFDEAVRSEEALTAAVVGELDRLRIPVVDARPELERALDEVGALYPLRRDDHPFEPGYRALAAAAGKLLARLDALDAGAP